MVVVIDKLAVQIIHPVKKHNKTKGNLKTRELFLSLVAAVVVIEGGCSCCHS